MTLLDRVSAVLTAHGVAHALIGAAALAARGVARSTFDLDLLTTDVRVLQSSLWTELITDAVTVDVRRGDADDPLGGVVRIEAARERPIDVVLGKHAWQARAVAHAEQVPQGPSIVLARDLILLKLYAGGTQDLWDIRELLRLPEVERLIADVDGALDEQPAAMRNLWLEAQQG